MKDNNLPSFLSAPFGSLMDSFFSVLQLEEQLLAIKVPAGIGLITQVSGIDISGSSPIYNFRRQYQAQTVQRAFLCITRDNESKFPPGFWIVLDLLFICYTKYSSKQSKSMCQWILFTYVPVDQGRASGSAQKRSSVRQIRLSMYQYWLPGQELKLYHPQFHL